MLNDFSNSENNPERRFDRKRRAREFRLDHRRVVWMPLEGPQFDAGEELDGGQLYNEIDFWHAFKTDLRMCRKCVILVSPFVDATGSVDILERLAQLVEKGVKVSLYTRQPDCYARKQVEKVLKDFTARGISIIFMNRIHQKVALLDQRICWEGSLNILYHTDSFEHMRRLEGTKIVAQMKANLRLP